MPSCMSLCLQHSEKKYEKRLLNILRTYFAEEAVEKYRAERTVYRYARKKESEKRSKRARSVEQSEVTTIPVDSDALIAELDAEMQEDEANAAPQEDKAAEEEDNQKVQESGGIYLPRRRNNPGYLMSRARWRQFRNLRVNTFSKLVGLPKSFARPIKRIKTE